jgi:hypothetical protein
MKTVRIDLERRTVPSITTKMPCRYSKITIVEEETDMAKNKIKYRNSRHHLSLVWLII